MQTKFLKRWLHNFITKTNNNHKVILTKIIQICFYGINFEICKEEGEPETQISSIGKTYQQSENIKTSENISVAGVEPNHEFLRRNIGG